MSIEKLENKINEKLNGIDENEILEQLNKIYRLISNTNKREESRLQYIEDKVNKVLEVLRFKGINTDEIKRKQEIEELEQKLKELRGE